MIDLVKHPEAVLEAKHGNLFTVYGRPVVFEVMKAMKGSEDKVYLTVAETDGDEDIDPEDKDRVQYSYAWRHVRHEKSMTALFERESLVELLRSGKFIIY